MIFKLMAYNVQDLFLQTAFPVGREHLHALSDPHWALLAPPDQELKPLSKLRALAAVILDEDPDCVCLSEVGGVGALDSFNELFLAGGYVPFITPGNSDRGIENGFLLKKSLPVSAELVSHRDWPVPFQYLHEAERTAYAVTALVAENFDLGHPQQRKLSRDLPVLHLYDRDGTALVSLMAVHLKSGYDPHGFDPGGHTRRAAEVRALVEIYQSLKAERGAQHPVIVAGDFNGNASREGTWPEFQAIYAETELEDALYLAGLPGAERHTHFTFYGNKISSRQLDYIFLGPELQGRLLPGGTYVHRYRSAEGSALMEPFTFRDRGLLPSDHYPVLCTFRLLSGG